MHETDEDDHNLKKDVEKNEPVGKRKYEDEDCEIICSVKQSKSTESHKNVRQDRAPQTNDDDVMIIEKSSELQDMAEIKDDCIIINCVERGDRSELQDTAEIEDDDCKIILVQPSSSSKIENVSVIEDFFMKEPVALSSASQINVKSTEGNIAIDFSYSKELEENCLNFDYKETNVCLMFLEVLMKKLKDFKNQTYCKNIFEDVEECVQNITSCLSTDTTENEQSKVSSHTYKEIKSCEILQVSQQSILKHGLKRECDIEFENTILHTQTGNLKDLQTTSVKSEITSSQHYQSPPRVEQDTCSFSNIDFSSIKIPPGLNTILDEISTKLLPVATPKELHSSENIAIKVEKEYCVVSNLDNEITENYTCNQHNNAISTKLLPVTTLDLIPVATPDLLPVTTPDLLPVATPDLLPVATPDLLPVATPDLLPVPTQDLLPVPTQDLLPVATQDLLPVATQDLLPVATLNTSENIAIKVEKDYSVVSNLDNENTKNYTCNQHNNATKLLTVATPNLLPVTTQDLLPVATLDSSENIRISKTGLKLENECSVVSKNVCKNAEKYTCTQHIGLKTIDARDINQQHCHATVISDVSTDDKRTSETNISKPNYTSQLGKKISNKGPEKFSTNRPQGTQRNFAQVPPVNSHMRTGMKGKTKISLEEYKNKNKTNTNVKNPILKDFHNIDSTNQITVSQHYEISNRTEQVTDIFNNSDFSSIEIPAGVNLLINSISTVVPIFTPRGLHSDTNEQNTLPNTTAHSDASSSNKMDRLATKDFNNKLPDNRNVSLLLKSLKEKIGNTFILSSDLYLIIIDWNVNWFSKYEASGQSVHFQPPVFPYTMELSPVRNKYRDEEHCYNVYIKFLLMECWYNMYLNWKEFRSTNQDQKGHIQNFETKIEFNEYVIEIFCHSSEKEKVPKMNEVVLLTFRTFKNEFVKMLGYVAEEKSRNYSLRHDCNKRAFQLLKSSGFDVKKHKISIRTVYKSDDINVKEMVMIKKLTSLTIFLEQNDALFDMNKSPLYETVLSPMTSPYRLGVSLNIDNMGVVVDALYQKISDPDPLLALVFTSLSLPQKIQAISLLIIKLQKTKPNSKVIFISKSDSVLTETARRLLNHNVIFISKEKIPELENFTLKNLMEVKSNVHKELLKTDILRKANVLLAKLYGFRESWRNFTDLLLTLTEDTEISCCILNDAHSCSDTELYIPLTLGNHKYVLLGNKELLCDVSPISNSFGLSRSLFHRAFL